MIFKNSEEKRNTAWRTVMTVSSVLIIIIAAFFVVKLFTDNPLEGVWVSEDEGIRMDVRGDDSVVVTQSNGGESFTLDGSVDKKNKTFTVQLSGGNDWYVVLLRGGLNLFRQLCDIQPPAITVSLHQRDVVEEVDVWLMTFDLRDHTHDVQPGIVTHRELALHQPRNVPQELPVLLHVYI